MRRAGGASWRGSGIVTALLVLFYFGCAWGDNHRFGDIKWASCFRGEGDFYDPRFPEVCQDRSSRLRVGFTITAAWTMEFNTGQSMLQKLTEDKNAYDNSPDKMCGTVRGCKLRLNRNKNSPTNERRIGYRLGMSDTALNDLTIPANSNPDDTNSIVGCPVKDGGPSLCPNQVEEYDFSIMRLSMDSTIIYARYSFEILFPTDGDYTVFYEGCCRPGNLASAFEYTLNNADLTFHLRTGVSVKLGSSNLPSKSFRWTMPDIINLRYLGIRGDNDVCGDPTCTAVSECALKFKLQGYHPQDKFSSLVRYRLATVLEMGKYKCMEHTPLSNPIPSIPNRFIVNPERCPPGITTSIQAGAEPFTKPFASSQDLSVDAETGIVTFSVRASAMYQLTIMADVTVDGKLISTPLDLLVRVMETPGNRNPPKMSIIPDAGKNFVNLPPATSRLDVVTIECGRPTWMKGTTFKQDYLRVGFKDDDVRGCTNEPQFIHFITESHDLPKGVVFNKALAPAGNFTRLTSSGITPVQYGMAYLDIFWRPQCEDLSQIGIFMWCFRARDSFSGGGFQFLHSAPSQVSAAGIIDSSCIFINAKGPPANNFPPAFEAPTVYSQCNRGCCPCCGETGCLCDTGGSSCDACDGMYAETKNTFTYDLHATDSDAFTRVNFQIDFPVGGVENYISLADLNKTLTDVGVKMPRLEQNIKYGCNGAKYDSCVSDPRKTADATSKIEWTLPLDMDIIDIKAFKVCYRAVEEVSPFVDVMLWNKTYGTLPNSDSCWVCFMINVANQPRWIDQYGVEDKPICETGQISSFNFAVGQTTGNRIRLESEDTAPNQDIEISILADPGAPNGLELSPMRRLVMANGDISNKKFGRDLIFTPELGQEDTDYPVCFQATNINGLKSRTCCLNLRVIKGDPLWSLSKQWDPKQGCYVSCAWSNGATGQCMALGEPSSCPPQAVIDVTVGCNYKMAVHVEMNNAKYDPKLRVMELPSCENCVPGGIAVVACRAEQVNSTGCCGNGVCDGAETGMNCPRDCMPDAASLVPHPAYPNDPTWADFTFTPTRSQQGRTLLTCIEVYDSKFGTDVINPAREGSKAPSLCMVYRVQSCRYCVPAGATLKSISKHYLLNVDWLRLYNSNPDIPNPNMLIPSDMSDREPIYIGPRYTVEYGDTLLGIAAIMRTTVKSILENNPTVSHDGMLEVGSKLCLLLCSAAN